jgi:hypothetical protein
MMPSHYIAYACLALMGIASVLVAWALSMWHRHREINSMRRQWRAKVQNILVCPACGVVDEYGMHQDPECAVWARARAKHASLMDVKQCV